MNEKFEILYNFVINFLETIAQISRDNLDKRQRQQVANLKSDNKWGKPAPRKAIRKYCLEIDRPDLI